MQAYALRDPLPDSLGREFAEYPDLLARLLAARGIKTREEAERFLNPSYEGGRHDPFLLPDMERAAERVLRAMREGERIAIWSDYDCDGIPGGALLKDFFELVGFRNFENYIPHRHDEGYGLNVGGIEELARRGAVLLLTVDCGIGNAREVARANSLGLDVVVTDHHEVGPELPPAYAVVNPKRAGSRYPFASLSGTGVAWKLVEALLARGSFDLPAGKEKWLLDLVGIATIADMVPLRDENRVLARYGLAVIRKSRRPGLAQLFRFVRVPQARVTEDDVGFILAPRLNAASRMGSPEAAFRLLTSRDEREAGALAEHLERLNNERKGVVAAMVKEIRGRLAALGGARDVIVLGNPSWRPALLGLAANALAEDFGRPVFLWGREGTDILKGSCRSDGSVNVVALMSEAREVFLDYGGHAFSGGFSVSPEGVHRLEEALTEAYRAVAGEGCAPAPLLAEAELTLADVSEETYALIERLAPFGEGNRKPLFAFRDLAVAAARPFGKRGEHREIAVADSSGASARAVSFFAGEGVKALAPGDRVALVASIERSRFGRTPGLRLRIEAVS